MQSVNLVESTLFVDCVPAWASGDVVSATHFTNFIKVVRRVCCVMCVDRVNCVCVKSVKLVKLKLVSVSDSHTVKASAHFTQFTHLESGEQELIVTPFANGSSYASESSIYFR